MTQTTHPQRPLAATPTPQTVTLSRAEVEAAIADATARIAPTWPLDRFIAVNPLWSHIDRPLPAVAAELTALSGCRFLMRRSWYRAQWQSGSLRACHLRQAAADSATGVTVEALIALLDAPTPAPLPRKTVLDVADSQRDLGHAIPWDDFVQHHTSQFCASHLDEGQASLRPSREGGLYARWRRQALIDRTPAILIGLRDFSKRVDELPEAPLELVTVALQVLAIPRDEWRAYLGALLLDVNGWASWCAYLRWSARLEGGDDDHIVELLAIRLAWELLLFRAGGPEVAHHWAHAIAAWPKADAEALASQEVDWLLQHAVEIAWQDGVCRQLVLSPERATAPKTPQVQAAFCIDVRSEVFRRALEGAADDVQTIGFAGFFGLPIDYTPVGSATARPQLPGLFLAPLCAADTGVAAGVQERRANRLSSMKSWKLFKHGPLSSFSFVDAFGLLFGAKMLGETFRGSRRRGDEGYHQIGLSAHDHASRRPRLVAHRDGQPVTPAEASDLAAKILSGMSLTRDFAPLVVLVGHGSETRNNPHAAGYDCGACCGQTGEVNARAVAAMLNRRDVREGLRVRGIDVPDTTSFVGALHNTTTDAVTLFETAELPVAFKPAIDAFEVALSAAAEAARSERAPTLGLNSLDATARKAAILRRAHDWSEVRPEWGLANNAGFIVAPRARSRHMDLAGRSFLHDYRYDEDKDFSVLELIMTAPMVVTHWINFQYYASTVDNTRYGSGNKVLHNVVGGHLGVFEGNGGDLRIGLPLQSIHDGDKWRHDPLRLSVFIEAPTAAIDGVIAKHATVRDLVENGWLHLFQIDGDAEVVRRCHQGVWHPWRGLADI